MKAALQSQTDAARALEIFGSRTFVVGKEVFWGDDRLEDAVGLNLLREGSLDPPRQQLQLSHGQFIHWPGFFV
jgi:hypothetical protein